MSDTDAVIIEYRISPLVEGWVTEGKLMATLAAWSMIPSAGAPSITISKRVTVLGQQPCISRSPEGHHCGTPHGPQEAHSSTEDGALVTWYDQSCDRCSHGCASCECTCGHGAAPVSGLRPLVVCGDRDPVSDKPCLRSPGHTWPHRDAKQKGTETTSWWGLNQIL